MKKRYLMSLVPTCLVVATVATGGDGGGKQSPMEYTLYKGLSYSDSDPELKLDIFLPKEAPKPVPCVMVIQGAFHLVTSFCGPQVYAERREGDLPTFLRGEKTPGNRGVCGHAPLLGDVSGRLSSSICPPRRP